MFVDKLFADRFFSKNVEQKSKSQQFLCLSDSQITGTEYGNLLSTEFLHKIYDQHIHENIRQFTCYRSQKAYFMKVIMYKEC